MSLQMRLLMKVSQWHLHSRDALSSLGVWLSVDLVLDPEMWRAFKNHIARNTPTFWRLA